MTEGSTLRDAEPVFPSRLPPAQLRFADALVLCMCAGTASHALATTPSSSAKTHVEQSVNFLGEILPLLLKTCVLGKCGCDMEPAKKQYVRR